MFSQELYDKFPRSNAYESKKKDTKEAIALLAKNQAYKLVAEDFEAEESNTAVVIERVKESKKEKSNNSLNYEETGESEMGNVKFPTASKSRIRRMRQKDENEEWENDESFPIFNAAAAEEEKDSKERDEFADRLKQKDLEKQKAKLSHEGLTEHKRMRLNEEQRLEEVKRLREQSRREYLRNRAESQLDKLKYKIRDDEEMFDLSALSKHERTQFERNKNLLRISEDKNSLHQNIDRYAIPEEIKNKEQILKGKYRGDKEFRDEVNEWEKEKIASTQMKFGAMDSKEELDYDFVFDDQQIEFVSGSRLSGQKGEFKPTINESPRELKAASIKQVRQSLPVFPYREDFLKAMEEFQVLIIVGETGSGKTTQLTQYLHEAGYTKGNKKIGCTQPRRVAAMSVAARVAEEMNSRLGHEVGYSIRFEDCTSEKTIIKYMTDGMLLREFLLEPDLSSYSCIVIDEAHERTLHTDILFGLVKDLARFRKDLKVLISSATLDADRFSEYFDDAPIFNIPGRRYPVEIFYTKAPEADYVAAVITTIMQIHVTQPIGDILVFLTGQEEIETVMEHLTLICKKLGKKIRELIVAPIYSSLPSEMQSEIFRPTPTQARKVVLATNIAETSITIDGIVYVIDPGLVKQKNYNPKTEMESLSVVPVNLDLIFSVQRHQQCKELGVLVE